MNTPTLQTPDKLPSQSWWMKAIIFGYLAIMAGITLQLAGASPASGMEPKPGNTPGEPAEVRAPESLLEIQTQIQQIIAQRKPSVVALVDANQKTAGSTAVVVTPGGIVVTAAHTVLRKETTTLIFDDGRPVAANVLGWNQQADCALLQITEAPPEHGWPYTPLRQADLPLQSGEWVMSIAHARGYDPNRDIPVKTGIVGLAGNDTLIQSSCLITGGDSGGPLFDMDGKLAGIHSYIGEHLLSNHHVRSSAIQTHWPQMLRGERWGKSPVIPIQREESPERKLPDPQTTPPETPRDPRLDHCPTRELLEKTRNFRKTLPFISVQGVKLGNALPLTAGTYPGKHSFLCKWAEIETHTRELELELPGGPSGDNKTKPTVMRVFPEYDLVLLTTPGTPREPEATDDPVWETQPVSQGQLLFAVNEAGILAVGTASTSARNSTRNGNPYLGITVEEEPGGLRIQTVTPDSPAATAGLLEDDLIQKIAGIPIRHSLQMRRVIQLENRKGEAGKNPISLTILRGSKTESLDIQPQPKTQKQAEENPKMSLMDQMGVIPSKGRKTHPLEIESDMPVPANETGCPVINIKGESCELKAEEGFFGEGDPSPAGARRSPAPIPAGAPRNAPGSSKTLGEFSGHLNSKPRRQAGLDFF